MKRWDIAFRIAIVLLLTVIALELGGWRAIRETTHDVVRAVPRPGLKEEAPAAPAPGAGPDGIERLYQRDIEAGIQRSLRAEREQRASAPR